MSETVIPIETITTSDNIKQFMEKCNRNFASIVENGGGPRGRDGATGETGATGQRGNKFHYVTIDPDTSLDAREATAIVADLEDLQAGDFVFFGATSEDDNNQYRHCYAAFVTFEETSDGFVPVITNDTLVSLQGKKGEKGDEGSPSSPQFDATGDILLMKNPYKHLILPKYEEGQLSSTPSSTLCIVSGAVGFVSGDREKSAIKSGETDFSISSELNLSIAATQGKDVNIGDYGNGVVSNKINVTGNSIELNPNGTTNKITLDSTGVKLSGTVVVNNGIQVNGDISVANVNASSTINTQSISANALYLTNLYGLGSVSIDNSGFKVGGDAFVVGTNKKITIKSATTINSTVECSNTMKALVGTDSLYLGVPKFTFMLYPANAKTPTNWCDFSNAIKMPISGSESSNAPSSWHPSDNEVWFKYKYTNSSSTSTTVYVKINVTYAQFIKYAEGTRTYTYNETFDDTTTNTNTNSTQQTNQASYYAEAYDRTKAAPSVFGGGSMTAGGGSMFVDDDDWFLPVVPDWHPSLTDPAKLIKHILTNKGTMQDMSNVFTRVAKGATVNYTLPVPTLPSNVFKWIFKVS